jgi:hypothetical protein
MADHHQIEDFLAKLQQMFSKAISKNHQEGITHHENGHRNSGHRHAPELPKTQCSREEFEYLLSTMC